MDNQDNSLRGNGSGPVMNIMIGFLMATCTFGAMFILFKIPTSTEQFGTLSGRSSEQTDIPRELLLSPKKTITSTEELPAPVRESLLNRMKIEINFYDGSKVLITSSAGTAVVFDNKNIYSSKHVLDEALAYVRSLGFLFLNDKNNIPMSSNFSYSIHGVYKNKLVKLKLKKVAGANTALDIMTLESEISLRVKPLKTADLALGEKVYISGYTKLTVPVFGNYFGRKSLLMDSIDHTFTGITTGVIDDMPANRDIGRVYRVNTNVEPGFSGGPGYNKEGYFVGMTTWVSRGHNFVYAISAQDLIRFSEN